LERNKIVKFGRRKSRMKPRRFLPLEQRDEGKIRRDESKQWKEQRKGESIFFIETVKPHCLI
jgi:hypothetical protein